MPLPILSPAQAASELQRRRNSRRGLLGFVEYTYSRWQTGQHHVEICEALEALAKREIRRLLIEAPPRHSKSEIASRRFPAWYLGHNPEHQIIAASYNERLATNNGRSVRNIVGDSRYLNIFDGVSLAPDSKAAGRWNTSAGGAYLAAGIGGGITGWGANLGIIDDPFKGRQEADSQLIRDNVWDWYTSEFYTRLMPGGAVLMMLTRWHEDDLAARALDSEDWHRITLPAIQNEGSEKEQALWPAWYPLERLHEIRDVLPARDWYSLYQQSPRAEQGTYMLRDWFSERYDLRHDDKGKLLPPEPVNIYITGDFAVSERTSNNDPDFTELAVIGVGVSSKIYILDWWHGQTTPDVWIDALLDLCAKYKPLAFFGEGGVIRRSVEPFLAQRMRERSTYVRVEWINPIHDKTVRGRALQGLASMGRVIFPRNDWAQRVIDIVVGFPGARYDDAFDALALFCLALQSAHPAFAPAKKPKRVDRWARAEARASESGDDWKLS